MLRTLKIHNFRNFSQKELEFSEDLTLIFGNNGYGKSSILESVSLFSADVISKNKWEFLTKKGEESFYVQISNSSETLSISYNKERKQKIFSINEKKISSKKFYEHSLKLCHVDPTTMNMFILGPGKRRDFINQVLSSSFEGYGKCLKHYTKVLKSRNAVLAAINEAKTKESELDFWDTSFIEAAKEVYRYRYLLVEFFKNNSPSLKKFLSKDIADVVFEYQTKTNFEDPGKAIHEYLLKNRKRDIIIQKTHIGPHLDDFSILLDDQPLESFASRGETKSIIIGLKLLEAQFIEEKTDKKPIFLIDDFSSELDDTHRSALLSALENHQTIITNIYTIDALKAKKIKL